MRNDARAFRFCRSKCHKNFKMKRQPRKLRWTKTHRALAGKEMTVDSSVLLSQFAARRNVPVRYDRHLVSATIGAMRRVEQIRARRERAYTKRRLAGKAVRERARAEDRRTVVEGEHLIRKELKEMEAAKQLDLPPEQVATQRQPASTVMGEEKVRQKAKRRMLVDGSAEEERMDTD